MHSKTPTLWPEWLQLYIMFMKHEENVGCEQKPPPLARATLKSCVTEFDGNNTYCCSDKRGEVQSPK